LFWWFRSAARRRRRRAAGRTHGQHREPTSGAVAEPAT
jgi:hypothetical protein